MRATWFGLSPRASIFFASRTRAAVSTKGAPEMLPAALRGSETGHGAFAQNVRSNCANGAKHGVEHLTRAMPVSMCSVNERSAIPAHPSHARRGAACRTEFRLFVSGQILRDTRSRLKA
jgi:hypothetical protein